MFRHVIFAITTLAAIPITLTAPVFQAQAEQSPQERAQAFLERPDVKRRKVSADNGDPYAMVWLSDAIEKEVAQNSFDRKAILPFQVKYLMAAVEKGYGPAFKRMGDMAYYGYLPEATRMDAMGFYKKGGEAGDFDSAYQFWKMARDVKVCTDCIFDKYSKQYRFKPSKTEAEKKAMEGKSFAESEYLNAQRQAYDRGYLKYLKEKREAVNSAINMLSSKSLQDNWKAQSIVASDYLYGVRGLKTYAIPSEELMRGDKPTFMEPNRVTAREIYERFAAKGELSALVRLSELHLAGTFPEFEQDRTLFLKYAEAAAAKGNIKIANLIGNVIVRGEPFGIDFDLAAKYLLQAHKGGNASATTDLAFMFLDGRGVEKNEKLSLDLFEQAANRGSSKAASFLAEYWTKGLGGARNPMLAKIWSDKAVKNLEAENAGKKRMEQINQAADF